MSLLLLVFELAEVGNEFHALLDLDISIQAQKGYLLLCEHALNDVEHFLRLAEQKKFVAVAVQVIQKLTEDPQLARKSNLVERKLTFAFASCAFFFENILLRLEELVLSVVIQVQFAQRLVLKLEPQLLSLSANRFLVELEEQVRVVYDLAQTADDFQKLAIFSRLLHLLEPEHLFALADVEFIQIELRVSQRAKHDVLLALGQLALLSQLDLRSAQNVAQDKVFELLDAELRNFFLEGTRRGKAAFHNCLDKLFFEELQTTEQVGLHEVEQTPELLQVVLHGSAGQDEFVLGLQADCGFVGLRLVVLYFLGLVEDAVVPVSPLQQVLVDSKPFVRNEQNAAFFLHVLDYALPLFAAQ